jgi:hypothetical protein
MGKTIINESNPFFEMDDKEGDVLYSFTGKCGPINNNNPLRGKTVNLSKMYVDMLEYVREFLFGGEFASIIDRSKCSKVDLTRIVSEYTFKKYGICIQNVYNKIHDNKAGTPFGTDKIFNELKVKYGINGIDWMYLYKNMNILTNDVEILGYIANRIVYNDIHKYFITEYNLRTAGAGKKVKQYINNNVKVDQPRNIIKIEWNDGGKKDMILSDFVESYNHWWMKVTNSKNRANIRDYDVLLNGRSVTEVFPLYCPVFSNLRMNYTRIDFDGKDNLKKCSEIAGYNNRGETWSFASIDRIDSSKGYSYDNIRIISQYANKLKNVGSKEQIIRLGDYLKNNK